MWILVSGLALFFLVHFIPTFPDVRASRACALVTAVLRRSNSSFARPPSTSMPPAAPGTTLTNQLIPLLRHA
jgi:hypothetical protein